MTPPTPARRADLRRPLLPRCAALCLATAAAVAPALANPGPQDPPERAAGTGGKLRLTGGVSTVDGAGGGGLSPWALTSGGGTAGQWGGAAFLTGLRTQDYDLKGAGLALTWSDRLEVSLAHKDFDTRQNLAPLGLGGVHLKQDSLGLKWRVAGDAVLDSDRWMPQIAVGLLHHRVDAGALGPVLTGTLGAQLEGEEAYVSATKLWLAQGLLVNGTLRLTRANQGGLLGFGSHQDRRWHLQPEASVAWLLSPQLALGAEYRAMGDALHQSALGDGALAADDWKDLFIAWAPTRHLSLTLAHADLGRIAPAVQPRRQRGTYLSAQVAF
ncbi:DUF3034 family protein [Ideonella livida]|uniref:DUF3034 family protein n=1 Tax=Ideonella livida TaxID=2707176 RepID=A0A7C9PK46_9BURK|nr:DUF3034 family protein [Ideonella livida]NDY93689.1 DUF3034 family protein [Ideonella livida]